MIILKENLEELPNRKRINFINSLSGFKSANLIGTINSNGESNLAIFSSLVHIGADPALIGMVSRPNSVPRHTLENIKDTGVFSINSVSENIYRQAHLTSARIDVSESEFSFTGLTESYSSHSLAPSVKESPMSIYCSLKEVINISSNNTILIIGEVIAVELPEEAVFDDGAVNHNMLETVCVSGLDRYHRVTEIEQLPYAKQG